MTNVILSIWTIYDHPSDFPDHYVARRHDINSDGSKPCLKATLATDLETLRAGMERMNLTRLPRAPQDDPVIIESWV